MRRQPKPDSNLVVAPVDLQPSEAAVAAARANPAPTFALAVRLRALSTGVLIRALILFVAISVFLSAVFSIFMLTSPSTLLTSPVSFATFSAVVSNMYVSDPVATILDALAAPLLACICYGIGYLWLDSLHPDVVVTSKGLREGVITRGKVAVMIPWRYIEFWEVYLPQSGSQKPALFRVYSTTGTWITWVEPVGAQLAGRGVQGDRVAAFRQRAEEVHAVIVARTGLPLMIGSPE